MSMYVTGRTPPDAPASMAPSVPVLHGTGQTNYKDPSSKGTSGGRAGDMSGINVDPTNGTFWADNEFANNDVTAPFGNWGTAIANFALSPVLITPPIVTLTTT